MCALCVTSSTRVQPLICVWPAPQLYTCPAPHLAKLLGYNWGETGQKDRMGTLPQLHTPAVHYIALHYNNYTNHPCSALHFTIVHYTTPNTLAVHYNVTLHCSPLQCTTLHYPTLHFTKHPCSAIQCDITLLTPAVRYTAHHCNTLLCPMLH